MTGDWILIITTVIVRGPNKNANDVVQFNYFIPMSDRWSRRSNALRDLLYFEANNECRTKIGS